MSFPSKRTVHPEIGKIYDSERECPAFQCRGESEHLMWLTNEQRGRIVIS
jgi:hypothetical protein